MTPDKVLLTAAFLTVAFIGAYTVYSELATRYRTYKWRKEWKQKYPRNKQ